MTIPDDVMARAVEAAAREVIFTGRDPEPYELFRARTALEAALTVLRPEIERAAYERAAQWHDACRPDLFGADYGMASNKQRAALRQLNSLHENAARSIRALASELTP